MLRGEPQVAAVAAVERDEASPRPCSMRERAIDERFGLFPGPDHRRLRLSVRCSSTLTPREARDRAPVADRIDLARLALAVGERAAELVGALAAEHVARLPELRRVRLVGDVAQLRRDLALLHLPERLAAELEVVALVVDAVAAVALDLDAVVGRGDDVLLGDVLRRPAPAKRSACAGTESTPSCRRSCTRATPSGRSGAPDRGSSGSRRRCRP